MGHYRLLVGPVWAEVQEGDRSTVDKLLSIPDPQAARSMSVAARLSDGLEHYFDRERPGAFPAGLTWRLCQRLEKRGHTVEVAQDPEPPLIACPPADCLEGVTLRDNQHAALASALLWRRGLLWLATNAGKSEIIAALCHAFKLAGVSVVIVVPNVVILADLTKRLRDRTPWLKVGVVGDQQRDLAGDVVVGTYQTFQQACPSKGRPDPEMARVIELAGAVLVDETHHAGGAVYQRLLRMSYNAVYRLGFSGTVDKRTKRTDEKSIERSEPMAVKHRWDVESMLGPVVHRIENEEMIELGFSAAPRVFVVDDRRAYGPDVAPVVQRPASRMDGRRPKQVNVWAETFRRAVTQDVKWHASVARVARHLLLIGKPPFIFSHSVEHLQEMAKVFAERGVPYKLLYGKDPTARRNNVVDLFSRRRDFALLTSSIFDEGANVPEIRAVVFAGARRAPVELLQRIGRGIRKKDGDNTLTIVDFRPSHCAMLADQYEDRRAVYRSEGFPVQRILDITRLSEVSL